MTKRLGKNEFNSPLEEFAKTRTVSSTSRGKSHKKDGKTLGEIGDWEAKELKKDSPR